MYEVGILLLACQNKPILIGRKRLLISILILVNIPQADQRVSLAALVANGSTGCVKRLHENTLCLSQIPQALPGCSQSDEIIDLAPLIAQLFPTMDSAGAMVFRKSMVSQYSIRISQHRVQFGYLARTRFMAA